MTHKLVFYEDELLKRELGTINLDFVIIFLLGIKGPKIRDSFLRGFFRAKGLLYG